MVDYEARARRSQRVTLSALVALLVIIAIDTLIAPTQGRSPNVVIWLFLSLPLLAFIPTVRRGGINSFAWLGFVSLLYFAMSVTALFAPWRRWLDVLSLLFAVTLFIGAMLSVRYTARARRAKSS